MVGKSVYTASGTEVILTCQKFTERIYSGTHTSLVLYYVTEQDQLTNVSLRILWVCMLRQSSRYKWVRLNTHFRLPFCFPLVDFTLTFHRDSSCQLDRIKLKGISLSIPLNHNTPHAPHSIIFLLSFLLCPYLVACLAGMLAVTLQSESFQSKEKMPKPNTGVALELSIDEGSTATTGAGFVSKKRCEVPTDKCTCKFHHCET